MISIIIISHGPLSQALTETAEMILGKQDNLLALGLKPGDSPAVLKEALENAIAALSGSHELCIFTDILSGTPFNTVVALSQQHHFYHLAGINLPLLVEALSLRNYTGAGELINSLIESAPGTIINVNRLMEKI